MTMRVFVLALAMSALSIGSVAAVPLKSPVIPTIHSPSGKLYKASQLCPAKDLNKESHSTGTTIIECDQTTVTNKVHDYWVKVKV
jgi:hypothetical protein